MLAEDAARVFQHGLAVGRQPHAVAAAVEQLGSQVLFQQAQLARDGGLHQVEQAGGAGDVAGFRHGDERAQLLDVHGLPMQKIDASIRKFYFF